MLLLICYYLGNCSTMSIIINGNRILLLCNNAGSQFFNAVSLYYLIMLFFN